MENNEKKFDILNWTSESAPIKSKPSSNECPNGFKYKDGLCYGSLIN